MGRVGFEHPPLAPPKTSISAEAGAESGALDAPKTIPDAALSEIVEVWPKLPEHIRAAVLTLIHSASGGLGHEVQEVSGFRQGAETAALVRIRSMEPH